MENISVPRRGVLKALAAGGVTAAGYKVARSNLPSKPDSATATQQWAMVIDRAKCKGCGQCVRACRAHNDVPPSISWNQLVMIGECAGEPVYLPRPCMHCEHAPCVEVCPVSASYYRSDGIVMMDYDRCIGCRYCEVACPYHARAFNWETFDGPNPAVPEYGQPEVARRPRGVVEKCSFCYQRIDRGLEMGLTPGVDEEATPACVVACPVGARAFGDLNDPESEISRLIAEVPSCRLRDDLGTEPRVYYLHVRKLEEVGT